MRRLTQQEFLFRARRIFGTSYGYEKTRYLDSKHEIIVICPTHGAFMQMPLKHLAGQHCRKCADLIRSRNQAATLEDFLSSALNKHGEFYDYSHVLYSNRNTDVEIHCPVHGPFHQKPMHHLRGSGCQECAKRSTAEKQRYTTDEFIEEAISIHGLLYDYSLVVYEDCRKHIRIKCNVHDVFEQLPRHHLEGAGCHKCAAQQRQAHRRLALEEFLQRANNVHGNIYDYSGMAYIDLQTSVTIICRRHGPFNQRPTVHLQGKGCRTCGLKSGAVARRSDTQTFVARSLEIHAYNYVYDFVNYEGALKAVTINCPLHGPFQQTPVSHLAGKGCNECGKESSAALQTWTDEQFHSRAHSTHGERFDYSWAVYKHSQERVKILCRRHGINFMITPNAHLTGYGGCRLCASEKLSASNLSSRDVFINAALKIHNERYGYELVAYLGCGKKVKITCPYHGTFEQTPSAHLAGCGCKKCTVMGGFNRAYFETDPSKKDLPAILYLLRMKDHDGAEAFLKVGVTTKTVERRFSYRKSYRHLSIESVQTMRATLYEVWLCEQSVKRRFGTSTFKPRRKFPGDTECFAIEALNDILIWIRSVFDGRNCR